MSIWFNTSITSSEIGTFSNHQVPPRSRSEQIFAQNSLLQPNFGTPLSTRQIDRQGSSPLVQVFDRTITKALQENNLQQIKEAAQRSSLTFKQLIFHCTKRDKFQLLMELLPMVYGFRTPNDQLVVHPHFLQKMLEVVYSNWKKIEEVQKVESEILQIISHPRAPKSDERYIFLEGAFAARVQQGDVAFLQHILNHQSADEISSDCLEEALVFILEKRSSSEEIPMIELIIQEGFIKQGYTLKRNTALKLLNKVLPLSNTDLRNKIVSLCPFLVGKPNRIAHNIYFKMKGQEQKLRDAISPLVVSDPYFLLAAVKDSNIEMITKSITSTNPFRFRSYNRLLKKAETEEVKNLLIKNWDRLIGNSMSDEFLVFLGDRLIEAAKNHDVNEIEKIEKRAGDSIIPSKARKKAVQEAKKHPKEKSDALMNHLRSLPKEKGCILM